MRHTVLTFRMIFVRRAILILALLSEIAGANVAQAAKDPSFSHQMAEVAVSTHWLRLLHYYKSFLSGQTRSKLEGPDFFFSPQGQVDPLAELQASIRAFSSSSPDLAVGHLKQHPQCAFPERFRFLNQELNLRIPAVSCPLYEEFLKKFRARSTAVVFSNAHMSTPTAMFGHTFLKIISDRKSDLLDYGISFAAKTEEDGLGFIYRAVVGAYAGQFSLVPYYIKVNEYVNSASRDLWEYDLSLTQAETVSLISHVWEIENNSWFNYYFIDDNCSYQLLAALEAVKPEWDLTSGWLFVTPTEMVKRLMHLPGAVTRIRYRPSLRKKFLQKYKKLTSEERELFFKLKDGEIAAQNIKDPVLLDATALELQYEKQKGDPDFAVEKQENFKKLLLRRSEFGEELSPAQGINAYADPPDDEPETGHEPSRIGIAAGVQTQSNMSNRPFQEISYKFAYHDLLNNDRGYYRFSQFDFPWFTLRYVPETSSLSVERVDLFAIASFSPMSFLDQTISWKGNMVYYAPKDFGCLNCHVGHAEAGAGPSFELFSPQIVGYAMGLVYGEAGSSIGIRGGPKLQVGLLLNPLDFYKLHTTVSWVTDLFQHVRPGYFTEVNFEHSFSLARNIELRNQLVHFISNRSAPSGGENYTEGKLVFNFYF